MDLEKYTKNQKTSYLAELYKKLLDEETATEDMMKEDEKEEEFPNEVILEVRAGAGGEEASLFAEELAHMYTRYAENQGWSVAKINESLSPIGGYKEASFEIRGREG